MTRALAIIAAFAAFMVLAFATPAAAQGCAGSAPYWYQNNVSPPPPGFSLFLVPGVAAITVMSMNHRRTYVDPRSGRMVTTSPACQLIFSLTRSCGRYGEHC